MSALPTLAKRYSPGEILFLIFALAVNFVFFNQIMFRCFNFYDSAIFLETGYRIYWGQKPFVDFMLPLPPVHMYMLAFFFWVFGVGKNAVFFHVVIVNSIILLVTYDAFRRWLHPIATALISFLSLACFYGVMPFPWYNQSAHLWGILGCALLIRYFPTESLNSAKKIWLILGLLVPLALFTKPNIGIPYMLAYAAAWLGSRFKVRSLDAMVLGGALSLLTLIFFVTPDLKPFIEQCVGFALRQTARAKDPVYAMEFGANYYWLICLLALYPALKLWKTHKPLIFLFWALWPVAIYATYSSTVRRHTDVELTAILMGLALLFHYESLKSSIKKISIIFQRFTLTLLLILTLFLTALYAYYGVTLRWWLTPDDWLRTGDYAIQTGPMKGWLCDKRQGPTADLIADYILKNIPKNETILILTDMQIVSLMAEHEPIRGFPNAYMRYVCPAIGRETLMVRDRFLKNPPDWVLLNDVAKGFLAGLPQYLLIDSELSEKYHTAQRFGNYRLLKRNR